MGNKALFLDRDGVLIKDSHLLTRREDIQIFPRTKESLLKLKDKGHLIFLLSNQSVVARGLISFEDCIRLNQVILDIVDPEGDIFEEVYLCPYHPHANIEEFRVDHSWRKPNPGALLAWKEKYNLDFKKSYMVGDRFSDIECGIRAGCKTVLIGKGIDGYVDGEKWITYQEIKPTLRLESLERLVDYLAEI